MDLLLFDAPADDAPSAVLTLDRATNRTGGYWHGFVPGVGAGQLYGFRGTRAVGAGRRGSASTRRGSSCSIRTGAGVAVPPGYRPGPVAGGSGCDRSRDEERRRRPRRLRLGGRPPARPAAPRHGRLRGARAPASPRDPNSGVRRRAARHVRRVHRARSRTSSTSASPRSSCCRSSSSIALAAPAGLTNYWGYQPVSFFAPHAAVREPARTRSAPLDEFRDLVKALHRAGHRGHPRRRLQPHRRGRRRRPDVLLPRPRQRRLLPARRDDRRATPTTAGRGNTLNANGADRPPADPRQPALLGRARCTSTASASTSRRSCRATRTAARWPTRRSCGTSRPTRCWPGTKLIAEAWDAGGLYQVGSFVGDRWVEWNGRFRDDVRAFVTGRSAARSGPSRQRFLGSPDIYGHQDREAQSRASTSSPATTASRSTTSSRYDAKHNEANGEDNRDGSDDNLSWNCGVGGPDRRPGDRGAARAPGQEPPGARPARRRRPDAARWATRSGARQGGNNNAYCQDDATAAGSTGRLVEREAGLLRFTRG